jgi:murein DD-endopeptidase MepM/ murein hydrolase activator NlpD
MKDKNYSIIIVTEATSSNKEFVISSKLIRNSIISVFILLVIFGFVIFDYLTTSFDKEKMRRLERDNVKKEETIAQLTRNLEGTVKKLKKMAVFEERIKVIAGLQAPYALEEVGSGGPEYDSSISNESGDIEFQSPKQMVNQKPQTSKNVLDRSKQILNEAEKIESSLKYVETHINEQKAKFAATPSLIPTKGYISSGFGRRVHPVTGKRHNHQGLDIATQLGNKVIATADGYVLVTEFNSYLGNIVHIVHGYGYSTIYGHLASFKVKEGERVKRGQVIGFVGNTGISTAPHLHYAIMYMGKYLNPIDFIIE